MKTIYLGLGSNLGDREQMLRQALAALGESGVSVRRVSSVYETEPRDVRGQPSFLNMVAEAETDLLPMQLLSRVLNIEREMGRKRITAQGPRIIDIDILLIGRFIIDTPRLSVPHLRLHERRFVLEPLAELAGDLRHPVFRKTMRELLAAVANQHARRTALAIAPGG